MRARDGGVETTDGGSSEMHVRFQKTSLSIYDAYIYLLYAMIRSSQVEYITNNR